MFWKIIRWGGSLAVIVLVLAALSATDQKLDAGTLQPAPEQPATEQPAANKNFNL